MSPLVGLFGAVALVAWPGRTTPRPARRSWASSGAVIALVAVGGGLAGLPGVLLAGLASPVVVVALRRTAARAGTGPPPAGTALALDLVAAALRGGRPVSEALVLAAPAGGSAVSEAFVRTARLLDLGADPGEAWSGGDAQASAMLAPVAEVAVRSHASGVRLAGAFEALASELRADRGAAALARAERAGVQAMGPLAACFLPSFVCLGIVPVVAGVASTVVGSLH